MLARGDLASLCAPELALGKLAGKTLKEERRKASNLKHKHTHTYRDWDEVYALHQTQTAAFCKEFFLLFSTHPTPPPASSLVDPVYIFIFAP